MGFDNLSNKLNQAFRNIIGKGKLSERNMEAMLSEIRLALLEADVNFTVINEFLNNVKEESIGQKVYQSIKPDEMILSIVRSELIKLLGEKEATVTYRMNDITTIMFVGLQGSGKTTNLAKMVKVAKEKNNRKPLIIAADVIRPAAIEQLQVLGNQIGVEVFSLGTETKALETVKKGLQYAREKGYDTVFIDTAGRLHVDTELMEELQDIKKATRADEILLTVDAMTGQDIIHVAESFNERLTLTGLVVTKFDGDARGGGIVSVRKVTGVPVKFVGTGEKMDDFELFYPDRVADRILGMGDLSSLVEKIQEKIDQEEAEKISEHVKNGIYTLEDMEYSFRQVKKMGSLKNLMGMMPGMGQMANQVDDDEVNVEMKRSMAILSSMTREEKLHPELIRTSRKYRIAEGSGTTVAQVSRLLADYEKSKKQMKTLSRIGKSKGW